MRIVEEKVIQAGAGRFRSGEGHGTDVKQYLERVAKYVPAEVVAAYIFANGLATSSPWPGVLFILIFIICALCTPFYITRFTKTDKEAWTNGIVAFCAFIVWAYAIGGGFFPYFKLYNAPTASVILIIFTLISGIFVPASKPQPPKVKLIPGSPASPGE
jgi:hypothetical protein